ncbi:MAG: glycine C-acetyltransferase [Kiritimatiellae bacterium]|nr:glycine C-acetyltransferase [Kiritimatiellia bacterium]
MYGKFQAYLQETIADLKAKSLYKQEKIIATPQGSTVLLDNGTKLINMCANNYLGLANHPEIIEASREATAKYGYGMGSVRFICGTDTLHKKLERTLAEFTKMDDCILFGSCFDANGGVFEALLSKEDAIISDALNHASIIDGVRLCKAQRFRYANGDMADLERQLQAADEAGARFKLIATDGVFSMDGIIAPLKEICDLADKYGALVLVDDSHAVGVLGETGAGSVEDAGCLGRVDIITGTFGKALGGASGGYIAARQEIVDILRQKARPYLFSNAVPPPVAAASIKAIELVRTNPSLRAQLNANAKQFREGMTKLGFDLIPGHHPIVPVMLGDAAVAVKMSENLYRNGVYATAFFYPVVPQGKARIRTQMSAGHTAEEIDFAINAFAKSR